MEIIKKVREILDPIAEERKYLVVDVTYKREGGKLALRILVDKEGGIAMDECVRLNNDLSEILDKEDTIAGEYVLEVSSPGLDRKLKKNEDFIWAIGKNVKVTTYAPIDGKNVFTGKLLGLGEGTVVLDESGVSTEIPREKIANAKLEAQIDWSKL